MIKLNEIDLEIPSNSSSIPFKVIYLIEDDFIKESQNELKNNLAVLLNLEGASSFRIELEIKGIIFSCLLKKEENLLYLFSRFLTRELTLVASYEREGKLHELEELSKILDAYKNTKIENTPSALFQTTSQYNLPRLWSDEFLDVHERASYIKEEILKKVNLYRSSLFEKFSDFGLDLTASYALFRIHILKFLAILPSLDHDKKGIEVKKSLIESLLNLLKDSKKAKEKKLKGDKSPLKASYIFVSQILLFLFKLMPPALLAFLVRNVVKLMAKRFIAGSSILDARKSLDKLRMSGRDATLDQLGELVVSSEEADQYESKVLEIIYGVNKDEIRSVKNKAGILRAHVSIKVSALSHDFRPYAFDYTYKLVAPRLRRILLAASSEDVFINVDAEHYHFRDIVFRIYEKVLLETPELQKYAQTGIVLQAYLKDAASHLLDIEALAQKRNIPMPVRLVKGAYWDAETIEASVSNHQSFQFLNKEETDINYRQMVYKILQSDSLSLALASHNIDDHAFAEALRELKFPKANIIEHQCLHMTYEALSTGLSLMGYPVRNYIPVGNLLVGMAYLVRRIMENSSQVGFLTMMRSHKNKGSFKSPYEIHFEKIKNGSLIYSKGVSEFDPSFRNTTTFLPFKSEMLSLYHTSKNNFLRTLPLHFGEGKDIHVNNDEIKVLGTIHEDTVSELDAKIKKLGNSFLSSTWRSDLAFRTKVLLRLSSLLLVERHDLVNLIMYESGKTLTEAYADVDEAIDFVNFYIREAQKVDPTYKAKGVMAVIAPWNFPIAILCGMTSASLASGNACLVKPAEQTPLIGEAFVNLCHLAGVPQDILSLSHGDSLIGKAIVAHELISGVIFTGSKAVGVEIYNKLKGSYLSSFYHHGFVPKTVITEMGGKNAVIVTNNCEMDETISGLLYSAFAHAGQKCSAASRVLVHVEVLEAFLKRFKEAAMDLKIGPSTDFDTFVNPIITKEDAQRIRNVVKEATLEAQNFGGKVILDRSKERDDFVVGPTIILLPKKRALLKDSFFQKEIFGPVVHVVSFKDYDEAVMLHNSTEYALTSGIFSQSQNDIDYIASKLEAGNIYINRHNTGARVSIEPFGGHKMSGTGPKAGGIDYLKQFYFKEDNSSSSHFVRDEFNEEVKTCEFKRIEPSKVPLEDILLFLGRIQNKIHEFVHTRDQDLNESFKRFRENLSFQFLEMKESFPNRKIEGQISYNDVSLPLGTGYFILTSLEFDFSTLKNILLSLLKGNRIILFSFNEKADKVWEKISFYLLESNISADHFVFQKSSLLQYEKMKKENVNFLFFETIGEVTNKFRMFSYNAETPEAGLIKFITNNNEKSLFDEARVFSHVRSFAVNTMRHGAPLEIEI